MHERIIIDPEIQHGKPVIRGTRVPISRIVGGLASGMMKEDIMREYEVTEEDIWAALSFATELIHDWIVRLPDVEESFDVSQGPVFQMEGYESDAPADLSVNLDKYLYGEAYPK